MKRLLLALLLVVLAVAAVVVARHALGWRSDAERWEADAARVAAQLDTAAIRHRADSARAAELAAERDAESRRADAADARADSATARVVTRWRTVQSEPAPPECVPILAVYDSIVSQLVAVGEVRDSAFARKDRALSLAEAEIRVLRADNSRLSAALDSATDLLRRRPRPRRIPEWLAVGPGITAQGVSPVVVSVNVLPTAERAIRAIGRIF